MWSKCSHQPYCENIFRMLLGKFQMTANCYGGSNVAYMLILHSKYCINVPIGSRSNTWSGNIWNVPNLLSAGKWQVPSTRAYNVLKMFLLISRPPRPQCLLALHDRIISFVPQNTISPHGNDTTLVIPLNLHTVGIIDNVNGVTNVQRMAVVTMSLTPRTSPSMRGASLDEQHWTTRCSAGKHRCLTENRWRRMHQRTLGEYQIQSWRWCGCLDANAH